MANVITFKQVIIAILVYLVANALMMVAMDYGYNLVRWQCQMTP